MKCSSCGDSKETVGDVRGCRRCLRQGVAAGIPGDMKDERPLEEAVAASPGLANRFTPERRAPAPEERAPAPTPPAPRKRRGRS